MENTQTVEFGSAGATCKQPMSIQQGKKLLASMEQQALKHAGKAAAQGVLAGRALLTIKDLELYRLKGYGSFNQYLQKELSDLNRSWCFRQMRVAKEFSVDEAEVYGVESLRHLCTLSDEVFTNKSPRELLVGEHTKTDAQGVARTLNFQAEHSRRALFYLIDAFRKAKRPTRLALSPRAQQLATALIAAAEGRAVELRVSENGGKTTVMLSGDAAELAELLAGCNVSALVSAAA